MQPQLGRVAVFTGHFLPHIGGVEIYSHRLWTRLVRRGWDVLLVTSDVGGGPAEETVDGIRVRRVRTVALMGERFPVVLPSRPLAATVRALDAFRPTVVVTNLRFMPPCWLGAAYGWRRGVPRLHIEHGSSHVPLRSWLGNSVSVWLDRTVGRALVRSATRCVGVSTTSAAFAESLGAVRPAILPMGVDRGASDPVARERWRERLGMAEGDTGVLFLGRVTEDKGVLVLLDAWERLAPPANVHLAIVGEGAALPEVKRRASALARVKAIGAVPPSEVPSVMSACDIFVHPSAAAEGRPLSVVEAAAAGLAIVSTPQGVAGDLVASEDEGILVAPRDPAALASALRRAIEEPAARSARAAALRRKVLDTLGWDRVVAQAEAELVATQSAPPGTA